MHAGILCHVLRPLLLGHQYTSVGQCFFHELNEVGQVVQHAIRNSSISCSENAPLFLVHLLFYYRNLLYILAQRPPLTSLLDR